MKREKKDEKVNIKSKEAEEEAEEEPEEEEEEAETEDWCFICKDGGNLMLCDYQDCLKVYHPRCVGKKKSFPESGKHWVCRKHRCTLCLRTPKFCCYCCPNSFCQPCMYLSDFSPARGKKGFCKKCLKLVLLAEENSEYGLDGEKIDFEDRDSFECLFKEYWEIIKEKEGLSSKDVYSADVQLKEGGNRKCRFDSVKIVESEEGMNRTRSVSDTDDTKFQTRMGKRKAPRAQEYVGWGSKALIDFLKSIGKDTTKPLSQYDVESIVHDYIRERNLFHPQKKRKVVCDNKLYSLFRKKSINRVRIYGLLGTHITENLVSSDDDTSEDEDGMKLEEKKKDTMIRSMKRTMSSDMSSLEKEASPSVRQSHFASIIVGNIKLVYLRRTLVERLLKQPENSESKVLGSFVRVKNRDYLEKNSHRILQVEGIKKISKIHQMDAEIILQVSNIMEDIPIAMLSDVEFTEEECDELRQNMKNGLIQKPRAVELEQKARTLHEDITKHWIESELVRLQNCIDRANMKGLRRELWEYLEQRELLKQPGVQEQLLKEVPKVSPEILVDESESVDSLGGDTRSADETRRSG